MATLRQLLDTPFILYAESVQDEHGVWVRKAGFPELEGCSVIAPTTWDAVVALEKFLPLYLIERLRAGHVVPFPQHRGTVGDITAEERLEWAGLSGWTDKLDQPLESLATAGV